MLNDICRLQPGIRTKRISSYDRTGGNDDYIAIAAGTTAELAMMDGAGIVKHTNGFIIVFLSFPLIVLLRADR